MKKLSLLVFSLLTVTVMSLQAEVPAFVSGWAFPTVYDMDEEVTFYFDLSGGGFTETDDVYWWVWNPSEPDAGNWENSSEFAKFEYVGDLIWKKTIIPTEYFGMTKEAMWESERAFWFRAKTKSGSVESNVGNIPYPEQGMTGIDVLNGNMWAADPNEEFFTLRPVSIYLDANQAGLSGDIYLNTWINGEEGEQDFSYAQIGEASKMLDLGNGIYRKDIDPLSYYGVPIDYELIYIRASATNGSSTTEEIEFKALSLDPGIPAVYIYPSNPGYDDIIVINRVNPQKGEDEITYSITCTGYPNITGKLEKFPNTGTEKNRSVYLHLPSIEGWEVAPEKEIRIRLTGANNNRFFDQRIKLFSESRE